MVSVKEHLVCPLCEISLLSYLYSSIYINLKMWTFVLYSHAKFHDEIFTTLRVMLK